MISLSIDVLTHISSFDSEVCNLLIRSIPKFGRYSLTHQLELKNLFTKVTFKKDKKEYSVTSTVEVVCLGRTGVEMEALLAASVSALTIYDMMKWADKRMTIAAVKLLEKTGGKSGSYKR